MSTKYLKGILFLVSALSIVPLVICTSSITHAQENVFSVSPGAFTASNVPPLGTPYTIPQNLVVWNRDTNTRTVTITSEIPPEGDTTVGYEPIPNANWVIPYPSQTTINANSYSTVQIALNIPRWENLTSKKWEVWIVVERQALPGEVGTLRPVVVMKIETTTTLPPGAKSTTSLTISEENFTLQAGKSKYLTATLTSNSNPVGGETINWSTTVGTVTPSSGKTDTNGKVSVVYTAPNYDALVIVNASYAGSEQYESSSTNSYGTITATTPAPSSGISTGVIIGIAIAVGCGVIGAAILLVGRH